MAKNKKTTPTTPASFYGIPPTTFPQYTSGAWADLPTGTWGAPGGQYGPPVTPTPTPTPQTPTPSTPLPAPQTPTQGFNSLKGLLKSYNSKSLLSSLPADAMTQLTQGWGMFGGGAAMPASVHDYRKVYDKWRHTL